MNKSRLLSTAAWLTLAAIVAPAAAMAADAAPTTASVEEVVVTATRREQRVLDVPYNISAVSGDSIKKNQVVDNAELMRSIPGVSVVDRGYRNQGVVNNIQIRGLNVDSAALGDYAVSAVTPVSTYVNDTPLFAGFLLKDLDRVEVLRGPQGTLYGSGSLGGTVRYITKQPELGHFGGEINANGSHVEGSGSEGWSLDGMLNIPVGDTMALRLVGSRIDYPGLTDYRNVYVLDANGAPVAPNGVLAPDAQYRDVKDADTVGIWFGRASLLWRPNETFDATLTYAQQSDEIGGRRQETRGLDGWGVPYGKYENGSVQLEPSSRDVKMASLEANVDLGFATLTSSTSYFDHHGESISENTGFYAKAGFLSYYYNYPRPMASAVRSYLDRGFVQEVRLVSKGDGPLDYVVGAFYEDETREATQNSYLRGFKQWWDTAYPAYASAVAGDEDFTYDRHEKFTEKALFGELTYHLTDRLQVTGGMRAFWDETTNNTFQDIPIYTFLSDPTSATFDTTDSKVLFKGNVSYKFNDRGLLYATISQGYRRGGTNAVPTVGRYAEDPAWQVYKPDTVINYEVGAKGVVGRLSYNASLFYIDWKDIQLNTATPIWGFYTVANGDSARSMGLEAQIDGWATDQLHYSLGYTYTDAKLTADIFSPDAFHTLLAADGATLPAAPKHTLNWSADYTVPVGNEMSLVGRIGGYYQSSSRNALGIPGGRYNTEIKPFSLWNASLTLNRDRWSASLYVKNIFNSDGVTGEFTEAYMGTAPALGYYGNGSKVFISLPRTLGASINVTF